MKNLCAGILTIYFPQLFQYDQLVLLEGQINQKINSNDPGTDVGYWESLLQQLKAHMARVRTESETHILYIALWYHTRGIYIPTYVFLMVLVLLQARLRDKHQALLRKKLFSLRQQVSWASILSIRSGIYLEGEWEAQGSLSLSLSP